MVDSFFPAAVAYVAMPFVLPPLFAVIGFYLARDIGRKRDPDGPADSAG